MTKKWKTKRGFTLIELLLIVGMVGFMVAMILAMSKSGEDRDARLKKEQAAMLQAEQARQAAVAAPSEPQEAGAPKEEAQGKEELAAQAREKALGEALAQRESQALALKKELDEKAAQLAAQRQELERARTQQAEAQAGIARAKAGLGVQADKEQEHGADSLQWLGLGALMLGAIGGGAALAGRFKAKGAP